MYQTEDEAHRLLTNLTGIVLGLELVRQRTPLDERQARILDHALGSAREMRTLLEDQVARQVGWRTGNGELIPFDRRKAPRWQDGRHAAR